MLVVSKKEVVKVFLMGFGQYESGAGEDVWTGSIYDPGMIPAAWTTQWVSQYQPSVKSQFASFFQENKVLSIGAIAAAGLLLFGTIGKSKRKRRSRRGR